MVTVPASMTMPAVASRTVRSEDASSRSASSRVNIAGMCCTMTTGTCSVADNAGISIASALGPPVDTPTATMAGRTCPLDDGPA